jgi:hypothetical protein
VELTPGAVWFLNKICLPLLPSVVSSLKKWGCVSDLL